MTVEEPLVAHKDGSGQVAYQPSQLQVSPLAEFGSIDDGLALSDYLANFHNLS
jgi:hypothetical protein